jgi:hypothetical protein
MIDMGDDGKIADVCAVHEDGLKLYFSIQRSATDFKTEGVVKKGCFGEML